MIAFDALRKIADAVLYEGYLLYPYTASATKNRVRWQFGVVVPQAYADNGTGENAYMQTEVLLELRNEPVDLEVLVRFLHVQARTIERAAGSSFEPVADLTVDGTRHIAFDETVEEEIACAVEGDRSETPIDIPGAVQVDVLNGPDGVVAGRVVRKRWPLRGRIVVEREKVESVEKVRVRIENDSDVVPAAERATALRTAFVSTHTLFSATGDAFVSLLDPPEHAAAQAAACKNEHTWPVLAGVAGSDERYASLVLSSPIILYDFPRIAEPSDGDKFDGTEIDELLKLSVLGMSDAEKDEARATDPAARAIVDRAETLSSDELFALHGIVTTESGPGSGSVDVGGMTVAKGSHVRLHPKRRADSWDIFLADRDARVQGVYVDFEGETYVAVTVDDDPASDLHEWYGRSLFFYPDEIEPLAAPTARPSTSSG